MTQLCKKLDEIQDLNTEVLIITFGTLPAAQAWLRETRAPFQILLDFERSVYRSYGLERSFLRSWGPKTVWRYVCLFAVGRKWRGIQGDSA